MNTAQNNSHSLAAAITKAASKQTYYTIRFFVDRQLIQDAFRAYGYFRWVDDILDAQTGTEAGESEEVEAFEKAAFLIRQKELLEALYRGESPENLCAEEFMLADLVRSDTGQLSGLHSYLYNMMAVLEFDVNRRGRLISQAEITEYSRLLATAVTDALYYFIGHDDPSPDQKDPYLAATAAHIIHLLRDMREDIEAGYFNIPREYLQANGMAHWDLESQAGREWVRGRIQLARRYFNASRKSMAQVKNLRCRLAGIAYMARFEWMLRVIERDDYRLRFSYRERKSLRIALWMGWIILSAMFASIWIKPNPPTLAVDDSNRIKEL